VYFKVKLSEIKTQVIKKNEFKASFSTLQMKKAFLFYKYFFVWLFFFKNGGDSKE